MNNMLFQLKLVITLMIFASQAVFCQTYQTGKSFSGRSTGGNIGRSFKQNSPTITNQKTYQIYMKKNGYIGRTSGYFGEAANVAARGRNHHRNDELGPKMKILYSTTNKAAARGGEDLLIRRQRAKGKATNKINGIGSKNRNRSSYWEAAAKEFGFTLPDF